MSLFIAQEHLNSMENEPVLLSGITILERLVFCEDNLFVQNRSKNVHNMETWQKENLSYRTSPSGCFWILRLFSFRIEEGRHGFEEEVEVSSTASVAATTTSSCSSGKTQTSNKNSSGSREWAQNEINELIAIWEEEEALYNVRHPDYSIKQKRNNALDRVRSQLESAGIFATTTEIQNKLHSLRVYY